MRTTRERAQLPLPSQRARTGVAEGLLEGHSRDQERSGHGASRHLLECGKEEQAQAAAAHLLHSDEIQVQRIGVQDRNRIDDHGREQVFLIRNELRVQRRAGEHLHAGVTPQ
jgi:hypothetical protein